MSEVQASFFDEKAVNAFSQHNRREKGQYNGYMPKVLKNYKKLPNFSCFN